MLYGSAENNNNNNDVKVIKIIHYICVSVATFVVLLMVRIMTQKNKIVILGGGDEESYKNVLCVPRNIQAVMLTALCAAVIVLTEFYVREKYPKLLPIFIMLIHMIIGAVIIFAEIG